MESKKVINLFDNASNLAFKFRTKNWNEISDYPKRTYKTNSQIKFKTKMLKLSFCDYTDAHLLVKGRITITRAGDDA